jgi:peptidoglycan/LPS O-acetylase OafA/YrhL
MKEGGGARTQIVGLDLLRFFAAALVMNFHLGALAWAARGSTVGRLVGDTYALPPALPFTWFGWMGVEIFFVISGFVIANSANGASPYSFARSRAVRLLPGLWICATLSLLVMWLAPGFNHHELLKHWGLTMVLYPFGNWLDGVYWSLVVEIIFYALIFGLLWIDGFRYIDRLGFGLAMVSAVYWCAHFLLPLHVPSKIAMFLMLEYGGAFALGIALWATFMRQPSVVRTLTMLVGGAAVLMEIASMSGKKVEAFPGLAVSWLLPAAVFLVAIAVFAASVAAFKRELQPGPTGALWCRRLGLATYPLYLLHDPIGGSIVRICTAAGLEPLHALGLAEVAATVAAVLVALFLEMPLQAAVKRAFDVVVGRFAHPASAARRKTVPVPAA